MPGAGPEFPNTGTLSRPVDCPERSAVELLLLVREADVIGVDSDQSEIYSKQLARQFTARWWGLVGSERQPESA